MGSPHRLINMEFTVFAVESQAIPVINAIGSITGLLQLIQQYSGSNRVQCSGWHEDKVTRRNIDILQHIPLMACFQKLSELVGINWLRKAINDLRTRGRIHNVPAIGFAALLAFTF